MWFTVTKIDNKEKGFRKLQRASWKQDPVPTATEVSQILGLPDDQINAIIQREISIAKERKQLLEFLKYPKGVKEPALEPFVKILAEQRQQVREKSLKRFNVLVFKAGNLSSHSTYSGSLRALWKNLTPGDLVYWSYPKRKPNHA
ncbi:hypothetical protein GUITHDRAFT_121621 [Guillardia theta CCMP2712]|uniref:Uncharacterized protein n=1 Tax=Guillardia theta (strain CCMP2712) TaxID=905079 RepID=L1I8H6_GUITC|nr:hypothetical protein GUITHDRAFT_121621 [Guillardia theta CCMP2712]EKX32199.1 hypothetical protein GUITHDRAFT_121621 [Guillardia theta CCMP2712]|eukprot:XP_005819179.1 hypothetical protein GUITHDRAFT_121621 [Guillardia theta CCMP2712]